MRTFLAAAILIAAAAPATAPGQSFQVWTCTANDGTVEVYRIGPAVFQRAIEMHNIWSANWCGDGGQYCTMANGQFHWDGGDSGRFMLNLSTGAFVEINWDGRFTGTCRVTG